MAGSALDSPQQPAHSSSDVTRDQKQKSPSPGASKSRSRTSSEEKSSLDSPVQNPAFPERGESQCQSCQEGTSSREASTSLAPPLEPKAKAICSRLKIEKQIEILEICTRWIKLYNIERNGGKYFWDKVHEVFVSDGGKYSADSCKAFVTGRVQIYNQRAPIYEDLQRPLLAWMEAVDRHKKEGKQQKIYEEKAKKDKADKKKADKEKADKEKAEKKKDDKKKDDKKKDDKKKDDKKKDEKKKADKKKSDKMKADQEKAEMMKADRERAAKKAEKSNAKVGLGLKKPNLAGESPRSIVPDLQDEVDQSNSTGETRNPGIEPDPVPRPPKRMLSDITPVGELPLKRPRTSSFTAYSEGPEQDNGKTRATSLQPGHSQRRPSVPRRPAAKSAAKPTVTISSSATGEKRKRLAPKASVSHAPEPSYSPTKKVKTTNDFLGEVANRLEGHLTRIEANIWGKFEAVTKELEVIKSEVANLSEWHFQLNNAINHEQGTSVEKASTVEIRKTSEAVVTTTAEVEVIEHSPGNEQEDNEPKSTDENDAGIIEDAEPETKRARLETIQEVMDLDVETGRGAGTRRRSFPKPRCHGCGV